MKNVRNVKSGVPALGNSTEILSTRHAAPAPIRSISRRFSTSKPLAPSKGDLWSWNFPEHTTTRSRLVSLSSHCNKLAFQKDAHQAEPQRQWRSLSLSHVSMSLHLIGTKAMPTAIKRREIIFTFGGHIHNSNTSLAPQKNWSRNAQTGFSRVGPLNKIPIKIFPDLWWNLLYFCLGEWNFIYFPSVMIKV